MQSYLIRAGEDMTKVSVIIPVYNVEKYLPQCIESVLLQSLKDIEIICVNDGSTDGSLKVLQKFKARDNRIVIIDKANEGSGIARNTALAIAKGEYVYFVDSDDWLDNAGVLEKLYNKASADELDILIFGGLSCYEKDGKIAKSKGGYSLKNLDKKYFNKVFGAKDITKDVFKFPSTAWTKLYSRAFLLDNNIEFQRIKVCQDQLPFFHSMILAKKIEVLPELLYCYRKNRVGSEMTVKKKNHFSPIYVTYAVEELLKKIGLEDDYAELALGRYFGKATSWLGKFQEDLKQEYYVEYMELLTHLQNSRNGWWKYFNPTIKDGYWTLKMKQFVAKQKFMLLK